MRNHEKVEESADRQPEATVCLPYVSGVSEVLKRVLASVGIRTVLKLLRTLRRSLWHPKDVVPVIEMSDVVYCIPCKDCPATYVGETTRKLVRRLDEHKRAVRKGEMELSALAEHAWKEGHGVDWDEVAVLDHHHSLHERLSLEAIHIRRQPLALNRNNGLLPDVYNGLLGSL